MTATCTRWCEEKFLFHNLWDRSQAFQSVARSTNYRDLIKIAIMLNMILFQYYVCSNFRTYFFLTFKYSPFYLNITWIYYFLHFYVLLLLSGNITFSPSNPTVYLNFPTDFPSSLFKFPVWTLCLLFCYLLL